MDELQCLLVFGVFVAGMGEKGLNGLARLVLRAVHAGDVAFSQAAFLHFTSGPAQVPGAVQVSRFTTLAGFQILPAGLAIRATAADLLSAVHGARSLYKRVANPLKEVERVLFVRRNNFKPEHIDQSLLRHLLDA